MTIEFTDKEVDDVVRGLIIAMHTLDETTNWADIKLSDRLHTIVEMLRDNIALQS